MFSDKRFMLQALALAKNGLGSVAPNPMVGALVVKDQNIVGRAWHQKAGEAHAEVLALRNAGNSSIGSTIYVTLEPCSHQGKTPPCTEAILASGVERVVYGSADPNPKASGGGEFLRAKGLEVKVGVCAELEQQLNRGWRNLVFTGRPFVTLKLALSSDNRLSVGRGLQTQISCPQSQRFVQSLRAFSSAILVGAETCRVDDPLLTNRSGYGCDPKRIVVSSDLQLPPEAKMLQSNAAIVCPLGLDKMVKQAFLSKSIELIELDNQDDRPNLSSLFERLGEDGFESVLVEGGAELSRSLLSSALVDRLLIFKSSDSLGGDGPTLNVGDYIKIAGLELKSEMRSGSDRLCCYQRSN